MKRDRTYRRLPGVGRKGGSLATAVHRLYLGPDHVLCVERDGYTERYKRFYYKDIQCLTLCRTLSWRRWNIGLGVLLALLSGWMLWWMARDGDSQGEELVMIAILGGLVLLPFVVNLLLGPTCVCKLKTAVQTETLHSLQRWWPARRALRAISEAVWAVQGRVSADEVGGLLADWRARHPVVVGPHTALVPKHYGGRAHVCLIVMLGLDVMHSGVQIVWQNGVVTIMGYALFVGLATCGLAALLRQKGSDIPAGLARVVRLTLGYMLGLVFVDLLINAAGVLLYGGDSGPWGSGSYLQALVNLPPLDSPLLAVRLLFCVLVSSLLGMAGWLGWVRHRQTTQSIPDASLLSQPAQAVSESRPPPLPGFGVRDLVADGSLMPPESGVVPPLPASRPPPLSDLPGGMVS